MMGGVTCSSGDATLLLICNPPPHLPPSSSSAIAVVALALASVSSSSLLLLRSLSLKHTHTETRTHTHTSASSREASLISHRRCITSSARSRSSAWHREINQNTALPQYSLCQKRFFWHLISQHPHRWADYQYQIWRSIQHKSVLYTGSHTCLTQRILHWRRDVVYGSPGHGIAFS
eukprot:278664-Rhodomonas_salina.2